MLYIVSTPIGNLGDITERAKELLQKTEWIIAENPAHTGTLLDKFGFKGKRFSQFAEHNEQVALPKLIEGLLKADAVLVSDAGTPGISDPGFRLIREAILVGIPVSPIPGANAAIAALSASGLPTDKFIFLGFVPKSEIKFNNVIKEALDIEATIVFYESNHRIIKTLGFIATSWPFAKVVVAREITKLHEEFVRGTAVEVSEKFTARESVKGEIVVMISFKGVQ